ncbi:MAG: hypothetical protein AAFO99_15875 [Bacteroidota bacterium]
MNEMIRLASQYLIAAESSFLHANTNYGVALSFCTKEYCLSTEPLNESGYRLTLHYDSFSLEWRPPKGVGQKLDLHGRRHYEIVRWIETMAIDTGLPEAFRFDHRFPYVKISQDHMFYIVDDKRVIEPDGNIYETLVIDPAIESIGQMDFRGAI